MDSLFSSDMSLPSSSVSTNKNGFIFFIFVIILIVFIIVVVPWNKQCKKNIEEMSGGTLAQMFAQDSQDVYLKGNVDKLATGNVTMMFNQPTREFNVFQNRGQPLYSILLPDSNDNSSPKLLEVSNDYVNNIINNEVYRKENQLTFSNPVLTMTDVEKSQAQINSLIPNKTKDYKTINGEKQEKSDYLTFSEVPKSAKSKSKKSIPTISQNILPSSLGINVVSNSNPYELAKVAIQAAQTEQTANNLPPLTKWTDEDKLFQLYTDRAINDKNCRLDPASCTGFAGGARLNDGFVQSTKAVPYVSLDGGYFYPDSYTGSYWIEPNFDINKPYPWIPNSNRV